MARSLGYAVNDKQAKTIVLTFKIGNRNHSSSWGDSQILKMDSDLVFHTLRSFARRVILTDTRHLWDMTHPDYDGFIDIMKNLERIEM